MSSPYELVLGEELEGLHPRLRAYFAAIPPGHHGRGAGVFDRVGTPRRWLWPLLWLLQHGGVLFPGWHRDVPFVVVNRPSVTAGGLPSVAAVRRFRFTEGERAMIDSIEAVDGGRPGLVDHLGRPRLIEARLEAGVVDGALHMRSTAVALHLARLRVPVPTAIAPRVALIERFDDGTDSQHVSVELSAPLLGRLYEYSGSFHYEIRSGVGEQ
ncbi:uncharacterized protein DUF4166 [Microterricola gilva]|uniref:Uncharacterized protein DUF4166 n=1 Tax=Microterricola gilva TaxID=393267 RepID=A0A4Q8AM60_9MICO|nr:DUF4166 domain-containing protein [Microterricola gilva]RZU65063.1 uncharacterized protein DUF4166 [Microterricola gilva]